MLSHFTQGHQSIFWNGCVEGRVWHDEDRGSLEVDGFIGTPLSRRSYNLGFSHCFLSKPLHFLSLPISHPQTSWVPSGQCKSEPLLRASQAPFPPREASENLCSKSEHLAHLDQDRTGQRPLLTVRARRTEQSPALGAMFIHPQVRVAVLT